MCHRVVIFERHQILVIFPVSHRKQSESSLFCVKNISFLPCKSLNASGCACGQPDTSCLPLSHSSTKKYNLSLPVSLKYKKNTTCLPLSHSSTTGYNLSPPVPLKYNRIQLVSTCLTQVQQETINHPPYLLHYYYGPSTNLSHIAP